MEISHRDTTTPAAADLLPLLYDELRRLAQARLARLPEGQTLQPTALVHEAYVRLVGDEDPGWKSRAHFFGAAAMAMRDILVEQARRKGRVKHAGDRRRVELTDAAVQCIDLAPADLIALDAALDALADAHPRKHDVVMLRYFAGLPLEQVAELTGLSTRTVERDWRFARAWLHKRIAEDDA